MFRHKGQVNSAVEKIKPEEKKEKDELEKPEEKKEVVEEKKEEKITESGIRELLEKNLKWSQIIYEQNRKINSKLLWTTIASWIKIVIIVVPLALAIIFLAPMAKNLSALYSNLLLNGSVGTKSPESLEQIIKLLPINPAQQEQLKAILK